MIALSASFVGVRPLDFKNKSDALKMAVPRKGKCGKPAFYGKFRNLFRS